MDLLDAISRLGLLPMWFWLLFLGSACIFISVTLPLVWLAFIGGLLIFVGLVTIAKALK